MNLDKMKKKASQNRSNKVVVSDKELDELITGDGLSELENDGNHLFVYENYLDVVESGRLYKYTIIPEDEELEHIFFTIEVRRV